MLFNLQTTHIWGYKSISGGIKVEFVKNGHNLQLIGANFQYIYIYIYVVSESPIHQNFKFCHQKVQLAFLMTESPILLLKKFCHKDLMFLWIGLSDFPVSESPIHRKVQFCSIFIIRLLCSTKSIRKSSCVISLKRHFCKVQLSGAKFCY